MDGCRQADQKTRENITTTEDDDEFFDDIFLSETVSSIAAIETRLSDLLRSLPARPTGPDLDQRWENRVSTLRLSSRHRRYNEPQLASRVPKFCLSILR